MGELKPCPCCDAPAELVCEDSPQVCYVGCTKCGLATDTDFEESVAIEDWNRRPNHHPTPVQGEALPVVAEIDRLNALSKEYFDKMNGWREAYEQLDKDCRNLTQKVIPNLRAQLPDGMEHCTILFKECEHGHGWLTATNWVQHGCPTCERNTLRTQLSSALAESGEMREALRSASLEGLMLVEHLGRYPLRPDETGIAREIAYVEAKSRKQRYDDVLARHTTTQESADND
jgi:predicted  nucleic acid-binding Zn-ribbon protein